MGLAEFDGRIIPMHELPRFDYYTPLSAKFVHNLQYRNFGISNFLTFTDKFNLLSETGKNKDGISKYEISKITPKIVWDMRISYDFKLKNDIKFLQIWI